ncbi:unnamed protein product [Calicophoron daubneyi]|uniref:RRM domain-containing protein n=1 Tax=Calicophoron daubneyi TaxID=300641 RepID=A0AAV2TIT8_CALDB
MPLTDVNQVTTSLNTLQLKEVTSLSSTSAHHIAVLGRQPKHSTMASSTGVLGKQGNQNAAALSPEEGIVKLLERTKYTFVQENGQRRYGPPPNWRSDPPPRGCEVFIGKIPRDCFEDELIPVFEKIGPIYMFRLMMEFNGSNRGYGFCVYTNREDTKRAVQELDNYEIRKGKTIGVCFSVDNCRLFVGGIPKNKTRDEILTEMKRVTEGVKDVICYPSVTDKTKNRGFAFVEYESHKAAAMARRKLIPGRIQLWGQQIAVDWAEPEREVNEDIMSKVKILYVRNLMLSTTEDTLREHFIQVCGGDPNCVERVKKISDYAFIHFKEREQAAKCLHALNDTTIEGSRIEVTWAKPVDKNDLNARQQSSRSSNKLMNELALAKELNASTPLLFDARANAAAVVAASGLIPSLDSASPFLLPPVGQQPGVAPDLLSINPAALAVTGSAMNIGSPSGPRLLNGTRTGRRNAAGSRSAGIQRDRKHPVEVLEELSRHAGWGSPVYTALPADFVDSISGNKLQLYTGQVLLPNLHLQYQAARYYATPEEAKIGACETAIQSLQYNQMVLAEGDMNIPANTVRDTIVSPFVAPSEGLMNIPPLPVPFMPLSAIAIPHSQKLTSTPAVQTSDSVSNSSPACPSQDKVVSTAVYENSSGAPISSMLVSNRKDSQSSFSTVTTNSAQPTNPSSGTVNPTYTTLNGTSTSGNGNCGVSTTRFESTEFPSSVPNMMTSARSCAVICAQPGSLVTLSNFGPPPISQLIYPQQSLANLGPCTGFSTNPTSGPQVAYASFPNFRPLHQPQLSTLSTGSYGSCAALATNYALAFGSGVMPSGATFLPLQLQTTGPNTNNTLGLLQAQSNALQIPTAPNVPSQSGGQSAVAMNSTLPPQDCAQSLAMNGFDYSSQLLSAPLTASNMINPFANPSAYIMDPNGLTPGQAAAVMVGSGSTLSGLSSVGGVPQSVGNCTSEMIQSSTIGQSATLSVPQMPHTGLYTLGLPVPTMQTPPSQMSSTPSNQASLLGLLGQSQTNQQTAQNQPVANSNVSLPTTQPTPESSSQVSLPVPAPV